MEQHEVITRSLLTPSEVQSLADDEILLVVDGLKVRAPEIRFLRKPRTAAAITNACGHEIRRAAHSAELPR